MSDEQDINCPDAVRTRILNALPGAEILCTHEDLFIGWRWQPKQGPVRERSTVLGNLDRAADVWNMFASDAERLSVLLKVRG